MHVQDQTGVKGCAKGKGGKRNEGLYRIMGIHRPEVRTKHLLNKILRSAASLTIYIWSMGTCFRCVVDVSSSMTLVSGQVGDTSVLLLHCLRILHESQQGLR